MICMFHGKQQSFECDETCSVTQQRTDDTSTSHLDERIAGLHNVNQLQRAHIRRRHARQRVAYAPHVVVREIQRLEAACVCDGRLHAKKDGGSESMEKSANH